MSLVLHASRHHGAASAKSLSGRGWGLPNAGRDINNSTGAVIKLWSAEGHILDADLTEIVLAASDLIIAAKQRGIAPSLGAAGAHRQNSRVAVSQLTESTRLVGRPECQHCIGPR